ncbi:CHAT domain-containing protein [Okeania sp. KiyG1]|uniref:CHAT domain-containing tetratricopeptide repeat protein n=1 Tax=Okeania sp. KiyG1 TaxID=2720165 RepID=UPI0019214787|nr:CHAT domain-containing protein [Okeania sp. KiyG1]GFZ98512.1 hypothetical protein CYANOKiyG1_09850 [Okeania sp. KiyG1]
MNLFEQLGDFFSNVGEQATYFSLKARINLLKQQGQFDEAIELAKQSLDLARQIWRNENSEIANSLNNLAYLYYSQGKYSEAEPLFQEALAMIKRLFKTDHPLVANSLNNLAYLYSYQERYSESESLFQDALAIYKRLFKTDHPLLATSLNGLALLYNNQGKYIEAEPLFQESLAMRKRLFKTENLDIANSLNNLAYLYYYQERYSEAEPLFQESLAMKKCLFKTDHLDVANSLNSLAFFYHSQGKYSEAEPLYEETLAMTKRLFNGDNPYVANSLDGLALIYLIQGKYTEAEPLVQNALAMRRNLFKETDHPDVATSLNDLALLYNNQGKYIEAEPLFQEALAMRKRLFGEDNPETATSLNGLGLLYNNQGKYSEAEPLFQKALAIYKHWFKTDHPDVATSLNCLAMLYSNQGKYSKAEPLFQKALAMRKSLFKTDRPDVAVSLNNLAMLYNNQGKYSEAEPLFQDALAIYERLFTENHPVVATTLNNLGLLYKNQGKYDKAENIFKKALQIYKPFFKIGNLDIARSLNNLATVYDKQGKYSEAEPLFQDALAIYKRLFETNHPYLPTTLNNLGLIYLNQGKYSEAEHILKKALDIYEHLLIGDYPDVASNLNNLGLLYFIQEKYSEAEALFQNALAITKRLFTGGHFDLVRSLNNLAGVCATTNRYQESLKYFKEATEVEHRLMSQEFLGSSENDRMLFLDNIRITQYNLLSLVYQYFYPLEESPEKLDVIHTALDLVLKRKAISNAADAAFNSAMNSDRYPHLQDSFEKYRSLWKQIVNLQSSLYLPKNSSRLEANKELLNELYVEVETVQKKLSAEVPEMNLENQLVDRQEVASELPENSTLIEFAYFPVYDFTTNKYQTPRYLAFILPAKEPEKVQMIDLGAAEKIDNLISQVRQTISPVNLENLALVTKKVKLGTSKASNPSNSFVELTTTVFEPLKQYLQGEQLFICPDGKLTLIPFEILPVYGENNHLFIDKYQITYLTAARDLLRHKNQPKRIASESLVIADPNFDLSVEIPPTPLSKEEIPPTSLSKEEIPPTPLSKGGLEIPTTLEEKTDLSINLNSLKSEIIQTFGQKDKKPFLPVPMTREIAQAVAAEFKVKPLLQNDALKTHLTNSKCPKKLVLATHGFFLEQDQPPLERGEFDNPSQPTLERGEFIGSGFRLHQIKAEKNPLWRSGLALAGANTWLFGREIPEEADKGILFALDVAGLDLWANELIILIACETAVGDVKIGEGVKGLRSAFTAAGARLLIMSLWSVPAQVSILLMNRFLTNMQQKKLSSQQALQEAQIYIKTITRTELEALPTGEKILQESRSYWQNKSSELLDRWDEKNYPLQARYFWGAWVCVGREFKN